jgi:PAS domain S-box-containing protein
VVRNTLTGPNSRSRQVSSYVGALILPFLATWITAHTPSLHSIPFALSFTVIAGLGALGGFGPALMAIAVSVLSFNYHLRPPYHQFGFNADQLERSLVLLSAAFFLSFLSWKQRRTETKLRTALAALQERTEALSQAQQASELATWVFNSETMETFWDEGSTRIFGRPFADLNRQTVPLEFILPEDHEKMIEGVNASVRNGHPLRLEFRVQWPNGEIRWLEARGTKVPNSPNLWRGATFDVTRRKVVETALINSEKLAAMGRVASTVAHELNNPLESVTNLLYLASSDNNLSPTTRSYIALAEEELARLGNITRLTLTFARTGALRGPVVVAEIIESVLSVFHRKCELRGIAVERLFTLGVQIEIPVHELRQILINLIANAIDALPGERGRMRLQTLRERDRVVLRIEDNGQGIEIVDQARVFDAFFTTKKDVGTGIGLWVTKELVEKNGGHIYVESGDLPDGMRTRFSIEFSATSPVEQADLQPAT